MAHEMIVERLQDVVMADHANEMAVSGALRGIELRAYRTAGARQTTSAALRPAL